MGTLELWEGWVRRKDGRVSEELEDPRGQSFSLCPSPEGDRETAPTLFAEKSGAALSIIDGIVI
jgi:hypothetical protein